MGRSRKESGCQLLVEKHNHHSTCQGNQHQNLHFLDLEFQHHADRRSWLGTMDCHYLSEDMSIVLVEVCHQKDQELIYLQMLEVFGELGCL